MSEKYCPVGKIECVEVRIIPNMPVLFDVKYCNAADCNIGGCETCPCPSKQKPVEVEIKEGWHIDPASGVMVNVSKRGGGEYFCTNSNGYQNTLNNKDVAILVNTGEIKPTLSPIKLHEFYEKAQALNGSALMSIDFIALLKEYSMETEEVEEKACGNCKYNNGEFCNINCYTCKSQSKWEAKK